MRIEFDDGRPSKAKSEDKNVTRRDRELGFYIVFDNGRQEKIPIGFMRVSEMKPMESMLKEIADEIPRPLPVLQGER